MAQVVAVTGEPPTFDRGAGDSSKGEVMKQIGCAVALASLVTLPMFHCGSAAAEASLPASLERNPNIIVDYIKPRKPEDRLIPEYRARMAKYQRFVKIYERVTQRQVLEQFSEFMAPLRLPTKLRVRINECHINAPNAFYSPSEWTIQICYEWIDHGERTAPAVVSPEGVTREEALLGGFLGVLLHETAHAVSDILRLPVLGREEDSADEIAAFIMLQFGSDVARTAIKGTFHIWMTFANESEGVYWGQHSTPSQRYANYLCIGYGKEPDTFKDLAEQWLTPARRASCPQEYQQALNAFKKTILPHIDEELMRRVRATPVFRPGDGKW
jgi:hypothetical protein